MHLVDNNAQNCKYLISLTLSLYKIYLALLAPRDRHLRAICNLHRQSNNSNEWEGDVDKSHHNICSSYGNETIVSYAKINRSFIFGIMYRLA